MSLNMHDEDISESVFRQMTEEYRLLRMAIRFADGEIDAVNIGRFDVDEGQVYVIDSISEFSRSVALIRYMNKTYPVDTLFKWVEGDFEELERTSIFQWYEGRDGAVFFTPKLFDECSSYNGSCAWENWYKNEH